MCRAEWGCQADEEWSQWADSKRGTWKERWIERMSLSSSLPTKIRRFERKICCRHMHRNCPKGTVKYCEIIESWINRINWEPMTQPWKIEVTRKDNYSIGKTAIESDINWRENIYCQIINMKIGSTENDAIWAYNVLSFVRLPSWGGMVPLRLFDERCLSERQLSQIGLHRMKRTSTEVK